MAPKIGARLFNNVERLGTQIGVYLRSYTPVVLCSSTSIGLWYTYNVHKPSFTKTRGVFDGLSHRAITQCETIDDKGENSKGSCCKGGCCGAGPSEPLPETSEEDVGVADLPELTPAAERRIREEISQYKIVLFMKGTANKPACKFSRQAMDILKESRAPVIRTVNVLEDPELRAGIKRFSNYPNIPQLYVKGQFVGGLQTLLLMRENGTLKDIISEE